MASTNAQRVEAPVTVKAYLLCVFASFGGIFFGYDSGYMGGVLGMDGEWSSFSCVPGAGGSAGTWSAGDDAASPSIEPALGVPLTPHRLPDLR